MIKLGAVRQLSDSDAVPAPVGGWDASAPLSEMDADTAIELVNIRPRRQYASLRGGYASHATGLPSAAVETLMPWHGRTASKLFAACSTGIYDATSAGAVGAADVSSLTNARWQHVNFENATAHWLVAVNGADGVRTYDGTTWATQTITGVTAANLVNIAVHKKRVWFVENNSASGWYLATEAISGAASEFRFGSLWARGGVLQAIGTWSSSDAGSGPDDYMVALSSEGEAAVYAGTDPSNASAWSLVGVYSMPRPIGRRCMFNVGGDLVIITESGLLSFAAMVAKAEAKSVEAMVSRRIRDAWVISGAAYKNNNGWQVIDNPAWNELLVNVPITSENQQQYVVNVETGAWCCFKGYAASSWARLEDSLYFGGNNGVVYQADTGQQDDGAPIDWVYLSPFDDMRRPGRIKRILRVTPIIETTGDVQPAIRVNVDYQIAEPPGLSSSTPGDGMVWGSMTWGSMIWGGSPRTLRRKYAVGGTGTTHAIYAKGSCENCSLDWTQTEILYQPGGYN